MEGTNQRSFGRLCFIVLQIKVAKFIETTKRKKKPLALRVKLVVIQLLFLSIKITSINNF